MISRFLLINNIFIKGLKEISFFLDKTIYGIANTVYSAFYYLANANLLNETIIENFTRRIYAILGIVMVFVLAFNLLNYIIDPDRITDKKVGTSNLIKDIVIALVLLTIIPMLFTKLYSLQSKVLTSGVLSNLILGGYSDTNAPSKEEYEEAVQNGEDYNSLTDYYIKNGGNTMVASVFTTFLLPNDNFTVLECPDDSHSDYCDAYLSVKKDGDLNAFSDLKSRDDYNYMFLISTAAGIVLTFFMLSFCINLAKRAGKMAILQLIAPIPIILELLPNKKGTRKTWIETLIKTYLEVFFFMAVIYIVVFLISLIPNVVETLFSTATNAGFFVRVIVMVLLIFGLLQFGKEAPQMIFDLLGIKSTGIIKAAGLRGVAMAGVTGGLLGSTVGRFARNFNGTDGNIGQKLLSGVGGAGSGFARNLWGARNVHNLKDVRALRQKVNKDIVTARVNRDAYWQSHGKTLGRVIGGHAHDMLYGADSGFRSYLGQGPIDSQNIFARKKHIEEVNSKVKSVYKDKIEKGIFKSDAVWSQIKSMITAAEAAGIREKNEDGTYGELLYVAQDGTKIRYSDLKQRLADQETTLLNSKQNATKILEALGEMQNITDANQGVDGISSTHYDLTNFIKPDGTIDKSIYDQFINDVKKGSETKLDELKSDSKYQYQKIDEKLKHDAREATRQAAETANKKNDGKK